MRAGTPRKCFEISADILAGRHDHVAAEQDGRDDPAPRRRVPVDVFRDELPQVERALRVADEDDASPVVW